jgi:predicted nucleotidyltransferase
MAAVGVVAVSAGVAGVLVVSVADHRVAVARAEVGRGEKAAMTTGVAIPEKRIGEFVERLIESEGSNLESIVLYGSGASGTYDPEFSDINLLCVLRDTSVAALSRIAPTVQWWTETQRVPLIIGREELERSTDVFSIEIIEIKERYRVLYGQDVIQSLNVPMYLHRAQLEYELREKVILLREQLLLALGHERRTWSVLMLSFSALITLFRHALIASGEGRPGTSVATLDAIDARFSVDTTGFREVLEVREHRKRQHEVVLRSVIERYVRAAEQVSAAVDRMLDSPEQRNS